MKKIFYVIVAIAAITFSACNGTAKGGAETDSIAVDDSAVPTPPEANVDATISALSKAVADDDAEATQSLLAKAQAYIAKLQEEGKLEEAKALVKQVQDWLTTNAETVKSVVGENETLNKLVEGVKAIPVEALGAGEQAVEGAKAAADAAKDKADAAVDAAKQKTNEAVDAAKQKAADKINEAADKAADKAIKGLGL